MMKRMINIIGIGLLCWLCSGLSIAADSSTVGTQAQKQLGSSSSSVTLHQETVHSYTFRFKSRDLDWDTDYSLCFPKNHGQITNYNFGQVFTNALADKTVTKGKPTLRKGTYKASLIVQLTSKGGGSYFSLGDVRVYNPCVKLAARSTFQASIENGIAPGRDGRDNLLRELNLIHLGDKGYPFNPSQYGFDCPYGRRDTPSASRLPRNYTYEFKVEKSFLENPVDCVPEAEIDLYDAEGSRAIFGNSFTSAAIVYVTFTKLPSDTSSKIAPPSSP